MPKQLSALYDSGTELCCVDSAVIQHLELPKIGQVVLKGLNADVIRADLVCLYVKLPGGNSFLPVTCAVCSNLSSSMLIGTDVVRRLQDHLLSEQTGTKSLPTGNWQLCTVTEMSSVNNDDISDKNNLTDNIDNCIQVNTVNNVDREANDDDDDAVE